MSMIDDIVKQMLEEHEGGEVFFDNLDEAIRDKNILEKFYDNVCKVFMCGGRYDAVIMSGRFSRAMLNYTSILYDCFEYYGMDCICVNGSLRGDGRVEDFSICEPSFYEGSPKFLFLDDSFYSGKTRDKIKAKLESYGAELVHTHVLYDGCYETHDDVSSMYRYYDNH